MTDPNPLKQAAEEAKARKLAEVAAAHARDAQREREEAEWNMELGPAFRLLAPPAPLHVVRGGDVVQRAQAIGLAVDLEFPLPVHPERPAVVRVGVAGVRGSASVDDLERQLAQRGLRGLDAEELIEFWNAFPEYRTDESNATHYNIYGFACQHRRNDAGINDAGIDVLAIMDDIVCMPPLFPVSILTALRTMIPFTYIDPTP